MKLPIRINNMKSSIKLKYNKIKHSEDYKNFIDNIKYVSFSFVYKLESNSTFKHNLVYGVLLTPLIYMYYYINYMLVKEKNFTLDTRIGEKSRILNQSEFEYKVNDKQKLSYSFELNNY